MDPQPLVLVADDDVDVRDALAEVLDTNGFRVALAVDGQHALEQLGEGVTPCVILLDWMMPRLDGASFLNAREALAHSSIPVFVMSASHRPTADVRVEGYLPKPFDIADLLQVLHETCGSCPPSRRARCLKSQELSTD